MTKEEDENIEIFQTHARNPACGSVTMLSTWRLSLRILPRADQADWQRPQELLRLLSLLVLEK